MSRYPTQEYVCLNPTCPMCSNTYGTQWTSSGLFHCNSTYPIDLKVHPKDYPIVPPILSNPTCPSYPFVPI